MFTQYRRRDYRREYGAFNNMKYRCLNPKCRDYPEYGGRGITVSDDFLSKVRGEGFQAFMEAVGPRPGPGYSLDRIDNEGHYEAHNLRWATAKEQRNNQRPRRFIPRTWWTLNGETHRIHEWAGITGLSTQTLGWRKGKGFSDAAVTFPGHLKDFIRQHGRDALYKKD